MDIEELSLRCRSEQSRSYISEATLCYRAGAYRAAVVSTWIAVVFDLIDKVRELALAGDADAQASETKFQGYVDQINAGNQQGIKSALEFEREILNVCHERLQFFDQQQLVDLNRLKEDRHRCAHPSFQQVGVPYRVSAEQARLHIRNAVVHVLAQAPVQGKAAIAEVKKVVSSDYFPFDVQLGVAQLRTTGLVNPTPALVNGVIDALVFGYFNVGDSLYEKRQVLPALNGLYEMHPALYEARIGLQLSKLVRDLPDARLMWILYLVCHLRQGWVLLSQPARDKLVVLVGKVPDIEIIPALAVLSDVEQLRPLVELRIQRFDIAQLALVASQAALVRSVKSRAIGLLAESRNWGMVNEIFEKAVFPILDSVSAEDVSSIIGLYTKYGADLPGAHGYALFIEKVRAMLLIPDADLNVLLLNNGGGYLVPQVEPAQ